MYSVQVNLDIMLIDVKMENNLIDVKGIYHVR